MSLTKITRNSNKIKSNKAIPIRSEMELYDTFQILKKQGRRKIKLISLLKFLFSLLK